MLNKEVFDLSRFSRAATLLTAALLALALAVPAFAQADGAQVRVAHLAPDAPNVDVYVNGEPVSALQDVPYGTVSSYLMLPAGSQQVTVYPAGDTSQPVIDTPVDLASGGAYTIAAVGLVEDGSLTAQVYEDDLTAPAEGNAKVRAVHAVPDADAVDVVVPDGPTLVSGLEFPNASAYAEVPGGTYPINVNAAGTDQTLISAEAPLESGVNYSAFAIGTAAGESLDLLLVADTAMETPDTGGLPAGNVVLVSAGAALLLAGAGLYAVRRRLA